MNAKKTMTVLLVASLVVCWIVAGQLRGDDNVTPSAGQTRVLNIAGTWIGKFPIKNSPYEIPLIVTESLTPIDLTGRFACVMRMLNSDYTFTGMFPETNSVSDLVSEAVRTGPDTYELGGIGYRFVLESAAWETRRSAGDKLSLIQQWANRNTSWCAYRFRLKLYLTDKQGRDIFSDQYPHFDPRLWIKGQTHTVISRFNLPGNRRDRRSNTIPVGYRAHCVTVTRPGDSVWQPETGCEN